MNTEIKFFALIPIDEKIEYYSEIKDTELPKYIQKAKSGEIKHIEVCCYNNIGIFNSECLSRRVLEI